MAHILVVDDEASVRVSVCRLLRAHGYDARQAGGGAAALAALRDVPPALVLLDADMPGVSGFDVLRVARDDSGIGDVPIVMVTAGDASGKATAMRLGARDWLGKGRTDELLLAVERFVPTRRDDTSAAG